MATILRNLRKTLIAGLGLTVIMIIVVQQTSGADKFAVDHSYAAFFLKWLHVLSGIMWIGLLWYLNFVQIPNMPNVPDDQKPAIGKVIAPAVLFQFRWGAMVTVVTGLILAWMNGYVIFKN